MKGVNLLWLAHGWYSVIFHSWDAVVSMYSEKKISQIVLDGEISPTSLPPHGIKFLMDLYHVRVMSLCAMWRWPSAVGWIGSHRKLPWRKITYSFMNIKNVLFLPHPSKIPCSHVHFNVGQCVVHSRIFEVCTCIIHWYWWVRCSWVRLFISQKLITDHQTLIWWTKKFHFISISDIVE